MIARAAVSEGAMAAGRSAGGAGEVVGIVAGLGAEALLVGARQARHALVDLPARPRLGGARCRSPPGAHEVVVAARGRRRGERRVPIQVAQGGYAAVVVTEPR